MQRKLNNHLENLKLDLVEYEDDLKLINEPFFNPKSNVSMNVL